ncbi:hypothetical protein HWV62_39049 [Athelia sp. TMB]|nr:hypothetical protein HWV62_39049 [Athelia sp. TMB]
MSTSASQVYARQLLSQKLGYPLYVPEPYESLPEACRQRGVSIGDVGIIAQDGSFTYAFNACAAAADPVNWNGVPIGLKPIQINPLRVARWQSIHKKGFEIVSSFIKKENVDISEGLKENELLHVPAGVTLGHWLTSSCSEAAVLNMHDGASRGDSFSCSIIRGPKQLTSSSSSRKRDMNDLPESETPADYHWSFDETDGDSDSDARESQSEHDEHFSRQNDIGGLQLSPYDESDFFQQYTVSNHSLKSRVKLNSNQNSSEAATSPFTKSLVSAPNISQPPPYLVQAQCQPQQVHAHHGSSASARESEQGGQMIYKRLRTPEEEGDSEHMDTSSSEDEDSKARQELKSKFKREHLEEQTREQKLYQEKLVAQLEALRRQPRSKASAPHILPNANMLSPPQPAMLADGSSLSGLVARLPSVRGERPSVAREEEDVGDGCFKSDMFA